MTVSLLCIVASTQVVCFQLSNISDRDIVILRPGVSTWKELPQGARALLLAPLVVNRKGEIVKKYLGYIEHEVLEEEIQKMLAAG